MEDSVFDDYQFALEIFEKEEGRVANVNSPKDELVVAAIQVGVTHTRLKYEKRCNVIPIKRKL